MRLIDDLADLVLARRCLGCDVLGRPLCGSCVSSLRGGAVRVDCSAGIPAAAGTWYDGIVRTTVIAFKDHGELGLAPALGLLLADAVSRVAPADASTLVLVPVPGHRHSRRGYDATRIVTRRAADVLRRDRRVRVFRALETAFAYAPVKSLGRIDRASAVVGAFRLRRQPGRSRRPASAGDAAVIVVDDVITTGATAVEAVRALGYGGIRAAGIAACAATPLDATR